VPENGSFEVETGTYLRALLPHTTIGGDFQGDTALVGWDEAILIPEFDDGSGYGLALGRRWKRVGLELSYMQTSHDASVVGLGWGEADAQMVDLNFKYFFRTSRRLQPFLLLGLGSTWIDVPDASFDSAGEFDDASFSGSCANLGVGANYYLRRDLSIDIGLFHSWRSMNKVSGIHSDSQTLDDNLDASGVRAVLGLTYTF